MSHIYAVTDLAPDVRSAGSSDLMPARLYLPEQATTLAARMLDVSRYWQPELIDQLQPTQPTPVLIGQLARVNTPQSSFEQVHQLAAQQLYCVANARLDNREHLQQLLALDSLESIADGYLILLLYRQFHLQCLQHLLGDFAFIIWDGQRQQLFAACDHFGVKNLFYGQTELGLMVSNEHNALLTAPGIDQRINPQFMVQQWIRQPYTGYLPVCQGIHALAPAHYLLADRQGVRCERYWQLTTQTLPEYASMAQSVAGLRQRLEIAVKRRCLSQYPLAAELSEGLDSTAITAVAASYTSPAVLRTYSYRCEAPNADNAATYQDIFDFAAMYPNVQPQWLSQPVTSAELNQLQQQLDQAFGGPVPNSGQWLERYPLVQQAGIRTLLSGWGGDHCVSSYGDFYEDELYRQRKFRQLYLFLQRKQQRGRGGKPLKTVLRQSLKHHLPAVHQQYLRKKTSMIKFIHQQNQLQPLQQRWISPVNRQQSDVLLRRYDATSVQQRDWRELFDIGVHRRLIGSEITSRYFGIEYRFPLLDKELVEYVYSMPAAYKIWQGVERSMFRDAIQGWVTERIRTRLKSDVVLPTGFTSTSQQLLQQQLQQLTQVLQPHPVVQHFFAAAAFGEIPQRFQPFLQTAKTLEALQVICQLYDAGALTLPETASPAEQGSGPHARPQTKPHPKQASTSTGQ